MLADRFGAKLRRDFELADAIRDDMKAYGIEVDDRNKEWRADGQPFFRDFSDRGGGRGRGGGGGGGYSDRRGGGDRGDGGRSYGNRESSGRGGGGGGNYYRSTGY